MRGKLSAIPGSVGDCDSGVDSRHSEVVQRPAASKREREEHLAEVLERKAGIPRGRKMSKLQELKILRSIVHAIAPDIGIKV